MGTITALCEGAERHARDNGEETPGAEHFLLSALDLSDGTARNVFNRIGADPDKFGEAIKKQYHDALNRIGIDASTVLDPESVGVASNNRLYKSKPSAQSMMKQLVELRRGGKDIPLLGAHIVEVLAANKQGVTARSLKAMGIDQETLNGAVKAELNNYPVPR